MTKLLNFETFTNSSVLSEETVETLYQMIESETPEGEIIDFLNSLQENALVPVSRVYDHPGTSKRDYSAKVEKVMQFLSKHKGRITNAVIGAAGAYAGVSMVNYFAANPAITGAAGAAGTLYLKNKIKDYLARRKEAKKAYHRELHRIDR